MNSPSDEPGVTVKLREMYDILRSLESIPRLLEEHVKRTQDKDEEQDTRLANHGSRLALVEERLTRIEVERATEAQVESEERTERRSRRPNWAAIVSSSIAALLLFRDYILGIID